MNVNTVKTIPTDRVELVGFALEQSGHLWRVEQMIADTVDHPADVASLNRRVYNQMYIWNVGGFTQREVQQWIASKRQGKTQVTPSGAVFVPPATQMGADPSFVVGAKLEVLRNVFHANLEGGHIRAIMARLQMRGIIVSYEEAFKMWDEFRFG